MISCSIWVSSKFVENDINCSNPNKYQEPPKCPLYSLTCMRGRIVRVRGGLSEQTYE